MSLGLLATPTVTICKAAKMVFNVAPGNFYLSQYLEYQEANGTSATVEALAGLAGGTDAAFVTTVLTNLGLADDAGASAFLTSAVAASGRGAALEAAIAALDGVAADDATYGAAKTTFDSAIITSVSYSTNVANNSTDTAVLAAAITDEAVSAAATAGLSLALTTAVNTLTGSAGNDSFSGTQVFTDGGTSVSQADTATMTAADTMNAGDGVDTLVVTVTSTNDLNGQDAVFAGATVTGMENVSLRNITTAAAAEVLTVDAANLGGMTSLTLDRSSGATTVTNLDETTSLTIGGNGSVTLGATTATWDSDTAAVTATFADGTKGTPAIALNGTAATLNTLTINSTGAANTTGAVSSDGQITSATINAETGLTMSSLGVATNSGSQTLTISGAGAVSLGALDADFATINAADNSGGVTATLSATVAATFTGGSGGDKITTSTTGQTGAVNGGDGTDTLLVNATVDLDTTAEGDVYTGFEILEVQNGAAVDMDNVTGSTIASVVIEDAAGTTAITDMSADQSQNVRIDAANGAFTLGVKGATTVGTVDSLVIEVSDGDSTTAEAITTAADPTIAGVETITITATDDLTIADMTNISGLNRLVVSGPGDVSITSLALALGSNFSVDYSGLTKDTVLNLAGSTANPFAFTGSAKTDTVSTSVVGGSNITTGDDEDSITMQAITAGSSETVITLGAGADDVDVGLHEGNDAADKIRFVFASTDSVTASGETNGIDVAAGGITDSIINISSDEAAAATAGNLIEFDTDVAVTAFTFSTSAPTFGTTTVTNGGDFYIFDNNAGTTGNAILYQDTDGDKIIEHGEFAVSITGAAQFATGEFTVVSGDLLLTTA